MKTSKFLLAAALIIIVSLAALVWFYPPSGDFRVNNPFWNGLSTLDSKMNATTIDTLSALPSNPHGTAMLLVPYVQFSAGELSELNSYVSNGGTLVVLDDYGFGNQVLSGVGLSMRFAVYHCLIPCTIIRTSGFLK